MSKILWQQSLKGVRSIRQPCPVLLTTIEFISAAEEIV